MAGRRKQKHNKRHLSKKRADYDSDSDSDSYCECGSIEVNYSLKTIYVTDDITYDTADKFVKYIDTFEKDKANKITLKVSSKGGNPDAAMAMYDCINQSSLKITFVGYGSIMSTALIIMCGCDERLLCENTRLMWHASSIDIHFKDISPRQIEIKTKEIMLTENMSNKILAQHSCMSLKFWNSVNYELYFSPEEAVKMKIADRVMSGTRHNFIEGPQDNEFESALLSRCKA
jgi:ATP-dependent protease ClpP protease subunit